MASGQWCQVTSIAAVSELVSCLAAALLPDSDISLTFGPQPGRSWDLPCLAFTTTNIQMIQTASFRMIGILKPCNFLANATRTLDTGLW